MGFCVIMCAFPERAKHNIREWSGLQDLQGIPQVTIDNLKCEHLAH